MMAIKYKRKRPFFKRKNQADDENSVGVGRDRHPRLKKVRKGIVILPSLLTLTGIFLSFYAIVSAIKGQFALSAALILLAGVFDGLDGKVARLTNTTTRFGLELDSLADVISFGVAPALLMYIWCFAPLERIGWVSAFVFVSCGALRLARFNVQSGNIDPRRFNGLPIPAAAGMVATTVLFFRKLGLEAADYVIPLIILNYAVAILMVSNVKYHAFKELTIAKQKPFSATVAFVLLISLIAISPSVVLFILAFAYLLSGPFLTLSIFLKRRKARERETTERESADVEATS